MTALIAEILKLRRSLVWPVVVLLPIAVVLAGAATQLAAGESPAEGWHTVWVQSVVFYGLFPLAGGVGILGSLVWQPEHRGGNWNALLSARTSSWRIVVAKAGVIAALAAIMQLILVVAMIAIGKVSFGLPGTLPGPHLGTAALLMLAVVPVAVLQSGLSMALRSFTAPLAVALVGAGISVVGLMIGSPLAVLTPYGLVTRVSQLGSGTFADDGSIAGTDVVTLLGMTVLLATALIAMTVALLERRDLRS